MPFAHLNGIDLYHEVHGSGPAVLLSHGVGSNLLHWWQQVPVLAQRYRVITFDHRGFGRSTEDGQGPAANVDDVIALLDHLKIDKVALVGQSMGGITVGGVAARQPERVTALGLSCSGAGVVPVKPPASMMAGGPPKNYAEFAARSIDQDDFRKRHPSLCFLFESLTAFNERVDTSLLRGLAAIRHDVAPIVRANIPTLLIGGEDDNGVNEAMLALKELIPGSRFELVHDAGHLLFFEAAAAYNALLLSFLDQNVPR